MQADGIVFAKVEKEEDFAEFISQLNIQGDNFVIKPNWVEAAKGQYNEAKVMEMLFKTLNGKKTVIESHTVWRNQDTLKTGKEPFGDDKAFEKQDYIREQDKWFLDYTGLGKVLKKHNVDYINVTEEVWADRVVEKEKIKQIVEGKYPSIKNQELYSAVPKKIFDLQGATLISLGKIKTDGKNGMTLAVKNLFGLIPNPSRYEKYHGDRNSLLPYSILDENKIYRSLFDSVAINEGIYTAVEGNNPGAGKVVENLGLVVGGKDFVKTDIATAKLVGIDPKEIVYLPVVAEVFGGLDYDIKNLPENFVRPLQLIKAPEK